MVNHALVAPWSEVLAKAKPSDEPYLAHFNKDGVSLVYIAALHDYGENSPTFKTIKRAFAEFSPRVVIVEGVTEIDEQKRAAIVAESKQCVAENFRKCGENLYGVYLASVNNVPWTSAESPNQFVKNELLKASFTERDLCFFYFARQISQLVIEKDLRQNNFDQIANETIMAFANKLNIAENMTSAMFKSWYQEKMKEPFVLSKFDSEMVAPTVGLNMRFLNKISAAVGRIRDKYIVNVVANQLNQNQKVLIIYGGSHLLTEFDALVDMLGSPKIIRYQ